MKIEEVINYFNIYSSISQQTCSIELSIKIVKNLYYAKKEIFNYNKKIFEYMNFYSEKDEEGKPITDEKGVIIKEENIEKYNEKVNALQENEIDEPFIKFNLNELKELSLTIDEVEKLFPFIENI